MLCEIFNDSALRKIRVLTNQIYEVKSKIMYTFAITGLEGYLSGVYTHMRLFGTSVILYACIVYHDRVSCLPAATA